MELTELSQGIQEYLQATDLVAKDRLLRSWRRWLVRVPPADQGRVLEELKNLRFTEAQEEGKALSALLTGYFHSVMDQHHLALEHYNAALDRLTTTEAHHLKYLQARLRLARALSLAEIGQNQAALEEARVLGPVFDELIERYKLLAFGAEFVQLKALAYHHLGQNQLADENLSKVMKFSTLIDDDLVLARLEDTWGLVCLDLGKLDQALINFLTSSARKASLNDLLGQAVTLGNLGRFYGAQAQYDQAEFHLKKQVETCEIFPSGKRCIVALQELARVAIRQRQWTKAEDYLRRAELMVEKLDNTAARACQAYSWAEYHLAREDWDTAEKYHQQAVQSFGPNCGEFVHAHLTLQKARLAAARQDAMAEMLFGECVEHFQRIRRPVSLAQAEFEWGMWLQRRKLPEKAVHHIAQAILYARDVQAQNMANCFTDECQHIPTTYWIEALSQTKKLIQDLATEKARLEKFEGIEGPIHDIKNHIAMVVKYIQDVDKTGKNVLGGKVLANLHRALHLAQYAGAWLTSLYDGIHTDEGVLQIRGKPIKLAPVIASLRELFALYITAKEKPMTLNLPSELPDLTVLADERLLTAVLFNLVENARKHSGTDKAIEITVERQSGFALIKVIDHGRGIPRQLQDFIFEKWGRVAKEDGVTHSTGMGLYYSKVIVEKMGGKIGVISKVGEGSTFWFTVPLAETAAA